MRRVAFDIETVSPPLKPDEDPDFDNPHHFELQSAGIGIEEDGEVTEVKHVTRDGWGAESELAVIDDIVDNILDVEPNVTYTYNGTDFDFWLLRERALASGKETGDMSTYDRLRDIEEAAQHEDLQPHAWATYGDYTTLEEVLQAEVFESEDEWFQSQTHITDFNHGIDHHSWSWKNSRSDSADILTGADVAVLGEHYLDGVDEGRDDEEFQELQRMLDHYVRNDVKHLFPLADARPY
jgi:hypothetical protein